MATNFVQNGNVVSFTAPSDVLSGQPLKLGSLFLIVLVNAVTDEEAEGSVVGVFEMAKTSANTPTQFAKAYWDDTAKEVTTTATGNTLIGVFTEAYGAGTTKANVRLNGVGV